MKKDTILFVLSEIEKEMQIADLDRQLYLIERRDINLKKLEMITEQDKKTFSEIVKTHIEFIDDSNKMLTEDSIELFKVIIDMNMEYKENLEMLIGE